MTVWRKLFSRNNKLNYTVNDANQLDPDNIPAHIAIIMDGNGRWAKKRGLPRTLGHRAGVEALRGIVKAATKIGVQILTVYAFSTENWKRPASEVDLLMQLFSEYLDNEIDELDNNGVQIRFIGKTDELAETLQKKMAEAEQRTGCNIGLILNIAVNYGGRAEVIRAVRDIAQQVLAKKMLIEEITEQSIKTHLYTCDLPDPDLVIRTSGDLRLSNFLLWQSAYSELWFTDSNWPDFRAEHLIQAIANYQLRERRFGGLKNPK
ncbi:MAG: Undecaprenyl pyrophosphate synthase [Firmicutes bacterium]|nr:Undecaprenyl pyrophosphate synthase [Bacillota bacterium]